MDRDKLKEQLVRAYDKDAQRRDENERDAWKEGVREKFAKLLAEEEKSTLLEIGSGPGFDSKYFKNLGLQVLATDLSPGMVSKCKEKGLNAKVLDIYDLQSLNRRFDAVYSMNVILHVPRDDLMDIFHQIESVLNDDGLLFIGVYGGVNRESVITDNKKMGMPRFFSFMGDEAMREEIEKVFEVLSFETVKVDSSEDGFHFQSFILRKKG